MYVNCCCIEQRSNIYMSDIHNTLAEKYVPSQGFSRIVLYGATSLSISHLISLSQPHLDLILNGRQSHKKKNCLAIFDLGKDKRTLSMVSHYQVTDNAAPRLMQKSTTAEIGATCGSQQRCCRILSHVGNAQKLGMCHAWGLDLIPYRQMLKALGGRLV